ncbi:porin [Flavobacterium sp.]|uniref:porin n=1 Tax=Flavobacterium sp. TaxID=239 RepID=UPI002603ED0C|nr:porin [Flavobacterium sp.]
MKKLYSYLVLLFSVSGAFAQLTISNGNHTLEISGGVSAYYNYRVLKTGEFEKNKDRFKLRDAELQLEGRIGNTWEYELQVDFADMAANNNNAQPDPENPGLADAYIKYKGLKFVEIQAGYGKLFYSRSSMVPFTFSTYWQRADLTRGDIFSQRDVGVTVMKDFWNQRINAYAGIYTGLGELSLNGDNDASGQPEYAARVDFSYPSRFRYREIDDRITPIPMFTVGINARYANKALPDGEVFPDNATGEYGLKVINGKRYVYGFDAAFQYLGFSAQFEMHQIKGMPQLANDPLLHNLTAAQTGGYFLAGGYVAQVNYFAKSLKTIVSARYEQLDLNDLVRGNSRRFSPAIAYQIDGFDAMIKFQYFNILKEETIDPFKWQEQYRLGIQLNFK